MNIVKAKEIATMLKNKNKKTHEQNWKQGVTPKLE
jgi:hypothetical protein